MVHLTIKVVSIQTLENFVFAYPRGREGVTGSRKKMFKL